MEKYSSKDPLVSFLYSLLRDHLPAGEVEKLVQDTISEETVFTNGYLAQYAEDVANRLKSKAVLEELKEHSVEVRNCIHCNREFRAFIRHEKVFCSYICEITHTEDMLVIKAFNEAVAKEEKKI